MKVYHILDHFVPHYSGYVFRSKAILKHQKKAGIEPVALISPKHAQGLAESELIEGITCLRSHTNNGWPKLPFLKEKYLMRHFKYDMLKWIDREENFLIHAHSPVLNGIPAYSVAKRLKIPFIYEVRALWEDAAVDSGRTKKNSPRYHITRYLETNLLRKADKVFTICEGLRQEIIKRGIPENKIQVIPNGVDTAVFFPCEKNKALVERLEIADKIVIGFIGSFYKYEGLDCLIKAMPYIIRQRKDTVLILVGKGEADNGLRDLVRNLKLEKNVIFTGQAPHNEIINYYAVMDILAYPREHIRLTDLVTPLKPLEAMAMEKAVVGSDVGGIKELIHDGENGLIFNAGDPESLAKKCLDFINSPQKREILGKNARQYVLNERNWERIIGRELDIYEGLLKERDAYRN